MVVVLAVVVVKESRNLTLLRSLLNTEFFLRSSVLKRLLPGRRSRLRGEDGRAGAGLVSSSPPMIALNTVFSISSSDSSISGLSCFSLLLMSSTSPPASLSISFSVSSARGLILGMNLFLLFSGNVFRLLSRGVSKESSRKSSPSLTPGSSSPGLEIRSTNNSRMSPGFEIKFFRNSLISSPGMSESGNPELDSTFFCVDAALA